MKTTKTNRLLSAASALTTAMVLAVSAHTLAAETSFTLDGNDIRSSNVNGFTFKGFGVLSANGTSAVLMDYKSQHPEEYAELLRILFGGPNPIMHHVKIEMGNDRNNSTGPDPATMRLASEAANVRRHPGFQLAADAKKVNPDLRVSILRWNSPGWVNDNDDIYTWYKDTILAAYRTYGYMVDYVNPGVNEHSADLNWTKTYASRVGSDTVGFNSTTEQNLYNAIKVVISDEVGTGTFGDEMVSDASLRDAVDVAGFHYNTNDDSEGNFKRLASEFDLEIWNSEAQATFSNTAFRPNNNMRDPNVAGTGIGGKHGPLEMGNTIIKGFVNSHRTHFIYQPAIGSFYEGGQYSFKEIISARDPWSGFIHYDAGVQVLRHFSWFAKTGWENSTNGNGVWRAVPEASQTTATGTNPVNGRNGGPNYLTMASPDRQEFSTVFVNDSEYDQIYHMSVINMAYTNSPTLEYWETKAAANGQAFNSNYMQYRGTVSASDGTYTINVDPYSVVTVTTLDNSNVSAFNTPLPVEDERTVLDTDSTGDVQDTSDSFLYADDFDYSNQTAAVIDASGQVSGSEDYIDSRGGSQSVMPRYTSDRNGAFEAYLPSGSSNYVLRQQVDRNVNGLGGTWNNGSPLTGIGDFRWMNYKASVDVSFEHNSTAGGDNYAAIGVRQRGGGSSHWSSGTPYFLKFWFDGGWSLWANGSSIASGNVVSGSGGTTIDNFDTAYNAWHTISVEAVDATITAYIDGVEIASYTDSSPKLAGRVDLLSGYYHTRFDNLKVEKVEGYEPYYTEYLDNLEMHDLSPSATTKLNYGGSWAHENGKSMFDHHRSLSTSQDTGDYVQYSFTGTGLDILGPNDGSARLQVTVDGSVVQTDAVTRSSSSFYQTYEVRDLPYGQHTVRFTVTSGTLVVDSIGVVGNTEGADPGLVSGESYYIKSRNSDKCLRTLDGSSANATSVVQYTCGTNGFEQWTLNAIGNDQWNLVHVASGKYGDISGASTENGGNHIIWPSNGGDNQKWRLLDQGDGYYHIVNVNSGLLLDISNASSDDNANNIQWTDNGGYNQDWEFIPVQ